MSTIVRYRRGPRQREVGWVTDPWTVVREDGSTGPVVDGLALYADADAAIDWFAHRVGTLLRWEERRIAWVSPDGVRVRLMKDSPADDEAIPGLFAWAEWVRSEGGSPSSPGGTGITIMRATLDSRDRIVAWQRGVPAFTPIGGRIGGNLAPGPWTGEAVQLDLPGAYASTLGELIWDGEFRPMTSCEMSRSKMSPTTPTQDSAPTFYACTVAIPPYLRHGPLPMRPATPPTTADRILAGLDPPPYPIGETITGIWTAEEVTQARELDCRVEVDAVWSMPRNAELRPFAPWWRAIQRGRSMTGWAGDLAKKVGNATVGALCLRPGTLRAERWEGNRKVTVDLESRSPPRHHLLYETVTGRVRATLGALIDRCDDDALWWHTDGLWTTAERASFPGPRELIDAGGWRVKHRARAIDYLGPNAYAYTDDGIRTAYVLAGEPAIDAAAEFDRQWVQMLRDPARRRRATPVLQPGRAA